MEFRLTLRVNNASFWNSPVQWTRWLLQTRGTGLRERNFRRMRDMVCTFNSSIILAPSMGDPGTAHRPTSQLEHAAPSRRPHSKTDSAFSGWRTPKPETDPIAHSVKNASLVQAFPRLYLAHPRVGFKFGSNWTAAGQLSNVSIQTFQKIHRLIQWAGNFRRTIIRPLSGETGQTKGPQVKLTAPHRSPTRGSSNLTRPLKEGAHYPLRFGRRGCCSIRVRVQNLTGTGTITPMGWLRINLHIVQIGLYLTHPLSVICYRCFLFTSGTHTHPNSSHLQLTCNQQDKTLEPTSSLFVLPLTHSTLLPTPFSIDLDTLTLNESRTEHIRKDHQRHGHPQLATHSTTRSQPTQKWIHNLHTPTEILCEILLKDELHRRSLLIFLLVLSNKQHYISWELSRMARMGAPEWVAGVFRQCPRRGTTVLRMHWGPVPALGAPVTVPTFISSSTLSYIQAQRKSKNVTPANTDFFQHIFFQKNLCHLAFEGSNVKRQVGLGIHPALCLCFVCSLCTHKQIHVQWQTCFKKTHDLWALKMMFKNAKKTRKVAVRCASTSRFFLRCLFMPPAALPGCLLCFGSDWPPSSKWRSTLHFGSDGLLRPGPISRTQFRSTVRKSGVE